MGPQEVGPRLQELLHLESRNQQFNIVPHFSSSPVSTSTNTADGVLPTQDPARLDLTTSSLAPSSAGEQILNIFGRGPSIRDVAPRRVDEYMYLGLGLGMDS